MADPYIINWSSTLKAPISLPEETTNSSSTSIVLTGRGIDNYGEIQQENYIKLLENFTSASAPANPTVGQLWYQTDSISSTGTLRIRSTSNLWEDVFPVPQATSVIRGLVKVGTTLTISADGTLNYTLPIASEAVLGGVKIAANPNAYGLKITSGQGGGLLEYILPQASATVLGGVKIAPSSNITISGGSNGGFIDYILPMAGVGAPANASAVKLGGVKIKENGGLSLDANGFLSSAIEAISPATASNLGGIKVGEGLAVTSQGVLSVAVATPTILGGVKVGSGLTVTSDGSLSVASSTGGSSGVTSVNISGGSTGLTFSDGPITSSGTITVGGILNVANGGTGVSTVQALANAVLPSQTNKAKAFLTTDGTNVQWSTPSNVNQGYAILPGGLYLQWGTSAPVTYPGIGGGSTSINFPIPFPTACAGVQITRIGTASNSGNKRDSHAATNVTATSFSLFTDYEELVPQTFYWFAYGS